MMKQLFFKIKNREIDGRYFLSGSHIFLVLISIIFFNLQRKPSQIFFGIFCTLIFEFICFKLTNKYKNNTLFDRLLSAFTEIAGLLILLKSHLWWFYGFMGGITILLKYFIRSNERRHIFNPTNGAIVLALAIFPIYWFEARVDDFMLNLYPIIHVTLFGIFATWLGKTWRVSIGYIVAILFWGLIIFKPTNISQMIYTFGPEFGTIGFIYLWLMITDPKTAPIKNNEQFIYAFVIAGLHLFLRSQEFLYSRYFALFFITLLLYIRDFYRNNQASLSTN